MPKTSFRFSALIILLVLSALNLLSCSQQVATSTSAPIDSTPSAAISQTPAPVSPTIPAGAQELAILSYEENGYAHLFAYIPDKLPLTRLSSGNWDDITPAASPDGKKIAFASNRSGEWDLYLMDLSTARVTQLTNTPQYEGAPSWSPDGSYIAYEAYIDDNLEIVVGPADNPTQNAIQLTHSSAADYSPAWAPGGRQIAFISNGEVILADLDRTDAGRFTDLSNTDLAVESHPVWSSDGTKLAWSSTAQSVGRSGIYVWDAQSKHPAEWIGDGDYPAWNTSGDEILTTVPAPNETFLTIYGLDGKLIQPLAPFPENLRGLTWANLILPDNLPADFQHAAEVTPTKLWHIQAEPLDQGPANRYSVVDLQDVQAPYPQLSDLADEAFVALRKRVIQKAGWDALASLENAFVPLTTQMDPGFEEDWLYTGRGFAINSLMTNAGWMVAVREDFGSQTYWRLYLRAQLQDGSLGEPLHDVPWDLSARYKLDPQVYEQGGKYADVPAGYWVDVTSLARQYGWQRVSALPNWRTFYRGARFTEFALTEGLDFYSAMLQLYPPDVLVTPTRLLPPTSTASNTPTFTPTPTLTRTPWMTKYPTSTRTPSPTPAPTLTPTISPTPPTVIPT